MGALQLRTASSREKRYDALSGFLGETATLLTEFSGTVHQRIRTYAESRRDDVIAALTFTASLKNVVIVVHGPRGCAGAVTGIGRGKSDRAAKRNFVVTNLDERDTIMGADAKLRNAVTSSFQKYKPEGIIIVSGPSVSINNDDILSTVEDFSDEFGIPLIPVFASGFASQSAGTGTDIAAHGLVKFLPTVASGEKKGISLLSVDELDSDRSELAELLAIFEEPVTIFPDNSNLKEFQKVADSKATVSVEFDSTGYFAELLEEKFGTKTAKNIRPIGLGKTLQWLQEVETLLGKENVAKSYHAQKAASVAHIIEDRILEGVSVFIQQPVASALGLSELVHELGGTVVGISTDSFDRRSVPELLELVDTRPSIQVHLGDNQQFELTNIFARTKPELVLGSLDTAQTALGLGISAINLDRIALLGYNGIVQISEAIRAVLNNRSFTEKLADQIRPYGDNWLSRNPNWHIKQEVK